MSEISFGSLSLSYLLLPFPTVFGFAIFLYIVIFSLSSIADCSDSEIPSPTILKGVILCCRISRGRNNSSANRRQRRSQRETLSLAPRICTYEAYTRPIIQGVLAYMRAQRTVHFHFISTLRLPAPARTAFVSCYRRYIQLKQPCVLSFHPVSSLIPCLFAGYYILMFLSLKILSTDNYVPMNRESIVNYYKNFVQNVFQKMLYYLYIILAYIVIFVLLFCQQIYSVGKFVF